MTQGGNPQLRLLALTECGTHALVDAVFDGVEQGQRAEARPEPAALPSAPGMLLLADRNFAGYELWGQAAATGADLAWRIKKNQVFTPVTVLPDGSLLLDHADARPRTSASARPAPPGELLPQRPPEGHLVRIIEYTITIGDC